MMKPIDKFLTNEATGDLSAKIDPVGDSKEFMMPTLKLILAHWETPSKRVSDKVGASSSTVELTIKDESTSLDKNGVKELMDFLSKAYKDML